ncbi:MAG: hypothetical protein N3B10_03745 [Armatimonadetes bacterium]|nr:hypothetical protein [Armatimonadota bacterium]
MIREALRAASELQQPHQRNFVVRMLVHLLSAVDPSEAASVARSITDPLQQGIALTYVVAETTKEDVDKAISIAEKVSDPYVRAIGFAEIGRVARSRHRSLKAFDQAVETAKGIDGASSRRQR